MTPIESQINELVDLLDTDRIVVAMHALQWHWAGAENGIPTTKEIKAEAKRLLHSAYDEVTSENQQQTIGCGGLKANCSLVDGKYYFELSFELTEVTSHWLDSWNS